MKTKSSFFKLFFIFGFISSIMFMGIEEIQSATILSPPSISPVSECNSSVRVQGQLTGATVLIIRNGDRAHPIGKGVPSWPDQVFSLTDLPPGGLQAEDKLTAIQVLGADESNESPIPVQVQKFDPEGLNHVICLSHLY